jgi:hypothetical protein
MKRRRKEIERYLAEEAQKRKQELTAYSDAHVSLVHEQSQSAYPCEAHDSRT